MRMAGAVVADVHYAIAKAVAPGVTTGDLDALAREIIRAAGGSPSFLGYQGYPAAICTSVNEEVVHGIPGTRVLVEGDIVAVDIGVYLNGFHGDSARTYAVGAIDERLVGLIDAAKAAFEAGVAAAIAGNRVGDISSAIQNSIVAGGFQAIRGYGGHGVGRRMHEDPSIPNEGSPATGARLQSGMTLAIEPMLSLGGGEVVELDDGWTVVTLDGSPTSHYEHTVLITESEPVMLTQFIREMVY